MKLKDYLLLEFKTYEEAAKEKEKLQRKYKNLKKGIKVTTKKEHTFEKSLMPGTIGILHNLDIGISGSHSVWAVAYVKIKSGKIIQIHPESLEIIK